MRTTIIVPIKSARGRFLLGSQKKSPSCTFDRNDYRCSHLCPYELRVCKCPLCRLDGGIQVCCLGHHGKTRGPDGGSDGLGARHALLFRDNERHHHGVSPCLLCDVPRRTLLSVAV